MCKEIAQKILNELFLLKKYYVLSSYFLMASLVIILSYLCKLLPPFLVCLTLIQQNEALSSFHYMRSSTNEIYY